MRATDSFAQYHPAVNFFYFASVIGFSVALRHPIYSAISLLGALVYLVLCEKKKGGLLALKFGLPILIFTFLLNPVFNHEGVTLLCYLPLGNPLTLESILYGLSAGVMFAAVLLWLANVNRVFTTDKYVCLFGKLLPALSLLISMTLRLIPKLRRRFSIVKEAQKGLGVDTENGSLLSRLKSTARVFSIVVTWELESGIESADSMKSRGYGLRGRTSYSLYRFEPRDEFCLAVIFLLDFLLFFGSVAGGAAFRFYPSVYMAAPTPMTIFLQIAYGVLCFLPVILCTHRKETTQWNVTR